MRSTLFAISILAAAASACSNKDPFDNDRIDAPVGGDGPHLDASTVDAPPRSCVAAPSRVVVLGDSITACTVIGGPQSMNCISKQFADYVIAHYAPGASYENYAVGGARLDDIAGQLNRVQAKAGPALVLIYIGGNDLAAYLYKSDDQATAGWQMIQAALDTVYANVFTALANTTTFPNGATLLMNTQYDPFDDCTASPFNLSPVKIAILHMFNDKLKAIAAAAGDAAIIVDQHPPFLGHGKHYEVTTCPYYQDKALSFMKVGDPIHANEAGNAQLASVANAGVDRLYRDCIP